MEDLGAGQWNLGFPPSGLPEVLTSQHLALFKAGLRKHKLGLSSTDYNCLTQIPEAALLPELCT